MERRFDALIDSLAARGITYERQLVIALASAAILIFTFGFVIPYLLTGA